MMDSQMLIHRKKEIEDIKNMGQEILDNAEYIKSISVSYEKEENDNESKYMILYKGTTASCLGLLEISKQSLIGSVK